MMPVDVSTCGANTTAGFSRWIVFTTSSTSCGANWGVDELSVGCPRMTMVSDGMPVCSKMSVHL